jgi:hypothetical protein
LHDSKNCKEKDADKAETTAINAAAFHDGVHFDLLLIISIIYLSNMSLLT